ncbi:MAG: flagellar filament capping protein FliD [Chloroflexi bacterium]|nr:flagellar filament capping protein FliD [Chloroflexota bacterium]
MADSPIRLSGFFSNIDYESILSQLTQVRQAPIRSLDAQRVKMLAQKTALTGLGGNFSGLLFRAKSLLDAASTSGKSTSVDGTGVTAAAGPSATTGSFKVAVSRLATGTTATGTVISAAVNQTAMLGVSNFNIPVNSGTFTMKTATGGSATITVDAATQSLDGVVAAINGSGIGITATIQNDAAGRPNILQLDSTQGAMTLGSGGDTSNFLAATNLIASPGTTTRSSTLGIARINTSNKLANSAFLGGPPNAGAQSFTLNGVTINYDTAADSLADVINRINASTAGVNARYDSASDTIKLTESKTGSLAITMADNGGGNFLAKTGLLAATQTLGSTAQYSVDGGATQYADSNTVTVNGTSLSFTAVTSTPVTVNVTQDTATALTNVKNFVAEYNGLMDAITAATKNNGADTSQAGVLSGDSTLTAIASSLRSIITSQGSNLSSNFTTLSQIGLSFGPVGSAVGSTNKLVLDETVFKKALASDPASVQAVLSQVKLAGTLTAGGTGSIAGLTGTYSGNRAGTYAIADDGLGTLTATFTPIDGGPDVVTTGAITAGGTNDTLIPGMVIQAGATLQAGSHTITVAASTESVISRIKTFLDVQSGAGGVLTKRQATYDTRLKDIDARKQKIQESIDNEMAAMRKKFIAMEQASARASSVSDALTASLAKLNAS